MSDPGDFEKRVERWSEVLDDSTYYELLGILDIADATAIKTAFHQFALAFHPDQHTGAKESLLEPVRRVFKRGAEAYRVLSDPGLRAKYDMALAQGHLRLDAGEIPKGVQPFAEGLKSLEDLCATPAAKLAARRADEYLNAGDLRSAKRELKMAIYHEGKKTPDLDERLDAMDLALFAMGD